ncbi:homeobox protein Mohawk-like [Gigantopelta aegis]|uniref:homeobox protein Mohawk-like n=1 Tax=Gigantopelta aegis TaxID=1735272 RepID=UPI001B88B23F|nr:homeobox protein Mohawk-like [Gigantopelta aegis]
MATKKTEEVAELNQPPRISHDPRRNPGSRMDTQRDGGGPVGAAEVGVVQGVEGLMDTEDTDLPRTRNLRTRSKRKLVPDKVHQKRQVLQDMARPLKQWLYHHRDNPYPTKSQKMTLATGSRMSLVQVSNWFANARRRLKNTVRSPDVTWAQRIKLYNNFVDGNAELFSVSSNDSIWDCDDDSCNGDQTPPTFPNDQSEMISANQSASSDDIVPSRANSPSLSGQNTMFTFNVPDEYSSHLKFKNTILQRYLNDHYQHSVDLEERSVPTTRSRKPSGSLGSRDYEEMSTSSNSSPLERQREFFDEFDVDVGARRRRSMAISKQEDDDEMYWKKIDAALALTNLARSSQNS